MENTITRSVLQLAAEEADNVEKHLDLLEDTYDLITFVESLYDSLPSHCRFPLDVATNDAGHAAGINAHLMLVCRRELTVGALALLRGYRIDFLFHMRKAIEFCAFSAKMARHPEMSRTWIMAASSDEAWEKFRDKFVKLYPKDDKELTQLSVLHDQASEAMHSSPKAVAHYLSGNIKVGTTHRVNPFDIKSDAVFVAYFITTLDCHLTILAVFQRILKPYLVDTEAWKQRLHDTKVVFTAKHVQWMPLVRTGIIKRTAPSRKEAE